MSSRAIVLFTGNPKREALRKGLPRGVLGSLHQKLIETARRRSDVTLVVASEDSGAFQLVAGDRSARVPATTLGEKIDAAYRFAFDLGSESVLVLAGDVAGVDGNVLDQAFATLETDSRQSVIGPSGDGGFYLLGLNRCGHLEAAIDWNSIPWFTAATSDALADAVRAVGGDVAFGSCIDDIDSYADAVRVARSLSVAFLKLRSRLQSLLTKHDPVAATPFVRRSAELYPLSLLRAPPLS